MKGILRKSLNDLFGRKIKFGDWQMALIYGAMVIIAILAFTL